MQLEKKIARQLIATGKTISIAESCTGGLLTNRLTNIPGSSAFLLAGIISYSNTSKTKLLRIPPSLIQKKGAVSSSVAGLMAKNVRKLFDTDLSVAISGIAGPTGGSSQKPVGLVFIAVQSRKHLLVDRNLFKGSRIQIKKQAADRALELLFKIING
jgi:PncC family amidohydrolase